MGVYEDSILPIKISQLAKYVSKVKRISLDEALVYVYLNPMYEQLYDENAKWWYLSTEALYEELEQHQKRQHTTEDETAFDFYTYCLENYALRNEMKGMKAWLLFKETGADKYLIENYDLLHTQGVDYVLDDISQFINNRTK